MGQIQLTISLLLVALFTIALLGFAINFANDNNAPINVAQDSAISGLNTNSQNNLSQFSVDANSQTQSIIETTIAPGSQTAQSVGPFAVTPTSSLGAVKNIVQVAYEKIFGTGAGFAIFINAFLATLLFLIGLYLYKTLRGFPD